MTYIRFSERAIQVMELWKVPIYIQSIWFGINAADKKRRLKILCKRPRSQFIMLVTIVEIQNCIDSYVLPTKRAEYMKETFKDYIGQSSFDFNLRDAQHQLDRIHSHVLFQRRVREGC